MKPPTFNSYEEISTQYPIDGIHNVCFSVSKHYDYCLRERDLELAKKEHSFGYFDKYENRWYYYLIENHVFYEYYYTDGKIWHLGLDSWDGIYEAIIPIFEKDLEHESGIFKNLEEAKEYIEYLLSEEYITKF